MLAEEVVREIEEAVAGVPQPANAAIDALQIVQRHYRWVSDEHLREVAARLQMSPDELDGIATFYNQIFRRPVGRHVIHLCDSVMCWMLGQPQLRAELERLGMRYGATSADDRFTLLPVQCLGACHRAPAMLVDGELHEGLSPERIADVLAGYP